MKKLDLLPTGPPWMCEMIKVVGDRIGEDGQANIDNVELWKRDALEIVKNLMSNPLFKDQIATHTDWVSKDWQTLAL